MNKIVIFGGMFDPPHIGHAALIDAVLRFFPCEEIWVMPSGSRLDKFPKICDEDRWEMVKVFCEDYFSDSKISVLPKNDELLMEKPTCTWALYQKLIKADPDFDFYFLVGSSVVPSIEKEWQHGREVFNNLQFLILKEKEIDFLLPSKSQILVDDFGKTNVSSAAIRQRIKEGFSPLPYVLPRINQYIRDSGLYK